MLITADDKRLAKLERQSNSAQLHGSIGKGLEWPMAMHVDADREREVNAEQVCAARIGHRDKRLGQHVVRALCFLAVRPSGAVLKILPCRCCDILLNKLTDMFELR